VVQPLVNKILERTSSLGQFVKNTPLKFGNRKKRSMRFTVSNQQDALPEESMEVEQESEVPMLSQPAFFPPAPAPTAVDFGLSSFSNPHIRPFADATPKRVSRTRSLKHSYSMASLPTQRAGLVAIRPPTDARPFKPMIEEQAGWIIELGSAEATPFTADLTPASARVQTAQPERSERWYSNYFVGKGVFDLYFFGNSPFLTTLTQSTKTTLP